MADTKISALVDGAPVTGTEQLVFARAGTTRRVSTQGIADLKTWANLAGKPATFPPDAHTHAAADITSGRLDAARLPLIGARVTHSVAQTTTSGADFVLAFNTERYDNGGLHDNATNNSRLTAPSTGIYLVTATARFAGVGGADGGRILLRKNGSTLVAASSHWDAGATDISVSTVLRLAATDYVEALVRQDSGSNQDIQKVNETSPEFAMQLLVAE